LELTEKHISLIAEICRRVDGLPLAIELAAARLKLLSLQELLERLEHRLALLTGGSRDLPTRQQTLRNTLVWSYELLTGEEQQLFRLLAVFARGCTLEAVESMYRALNGGDGPVLDGITSLFNKHLVYRSTQEDEWPRLMMLETIREFGWESLAANDELEQARDAHATYYLQLAEEAERYLFGAERVPWFNRLEQEHDNLRAALQWLLEQADAEEAKQWKEMALRLAAALVHFWASRGYVNEGHVWLERILKATKSSTRASLRAKAFSAAGMLATISGEYDGAASLYTESLKLYQEGGEAQGRALSQQWLGWIALRKHGDVQRARSMLEESSALFRKMGDKTNLAYSLHFLACQ
jgi:predicted ATPase